MDVDLTANPVRRDGSELWEPVDHFSPMSGSIPVVLSPGVGMAAP